MESANFEQLQNLPLSYIILFVILLACAIGGGCVLLYVGVCAALDAWRAHKEERAARKTWLADQERIHRDTG
jgi:hypothetical protein